MKKLLVIIVLLASTEAGAQTFTFNKKSVTMKSPDSLSLDQSFKMIDLLLPATSFYFDRYVVKNGQTYYRPAFGFFRKPKTYRIIDGSLYLVSDRKVSAIVRG